MNSLILQDVHLHSYHSRLFLLGLPLELCSSYD
jgi:hypothetical protein